ncbi:hypothetical protein HOC13_00405 [Candidatus Woesearchaeota archaeon]|nr:hypothetical protein [Candidatus Woesearchaeota archaeon]
MNYYQPNKKPVPVKQHYYTHQPKSKPPQDKKPLIIGVITVGAILLISLFFIFQTGPTAGQAFYTLETAQTGFAGLVLDNSDQVQLGKPFTLPVKANLGGESTAINFQMNYPPTWTCSITSKLDWGNDFYIHECNNGQITFEHATLDYTKAASGHTDIAEITFTPDSEGEFNIQFTEFQALKLGLGDTVLISLEDETLSPPPITVNPSQPLVQGISIEGGGFKATDLTPQVTNLGTKDFTTEVEALVDIQTDVFIITQIFEKDGQNGDKILTFKREIIEGGMQVGQTYISTVTYDLPVLPVTKKVFVYDFDKQYILNQNGETLTTIHSQ